MHERSVVNKSVAHELDLLNLLAVLAKWTLPPFVSCVWEFERLDLSLVLTSITCPMMWIQLIGD